MVYKRPVPEKIENYIANLYLIEAKQAGQGANQDYPPDVELKAAKMLFGISKTKLMGYYRKPAVINVEMEPHTLSLYPAKDTGSNPYNEMIANFCFPEGLRILTKTYMPKAYSFVLTNESARRTYAACLRFTEPLDPQKAALVYSLAS